MIDNHYNCPKTYKIWQLNCQDSTRKFQMDDRIKNQNDKRLYTEESLKDYNARKNEKGQFFTKNNS